MKNNQEEQKTLLITGASKGFGLAIVKAALEAGDKVVATVRNNPEELLEKMDHHANLFIVTMDVSKEDQVTTAIQEAIAHVGKFDVLINNAGFGMLTAIEEATDAEVRKQYDTNVFGLLNVTRAVLPHLRKARSGHIINISSMFGFDVVPGWGLYASTKFAVEGISKGLAVELAPLGIKVTIVEPGLYTTNFLSPGSYVESRHAIADYADTVGQRRLRAVLLDGKQPGDPKKLASGILQIAHTPNPPLHLLMGSDCVAFYQNNVEKTNKDVADWLSLSNSTDHDISNYHNS
jgi:NAD(P)-dependent dehydrogenase (short-subunit alcohol dehydrogenase family)